MDPVAIWTCQEFVYMAPRGRLWASCFRSFRVRCRDCSRLMNNLHKPLLKLPGAGDQNGNSKGMIRDLESRKAFRPHRRTVDNGLRDGMWGRGVV